MDNPVLTTLITAVVGGGGTSMLYLTGRGAFRYFTGRAGRERSRTRSIASELVKAHDARDNADAYRRVIAEYASTLRGLMNENGLGHLVPPWPANPTNEE